MQPAISIIMPIFNGERTLPRSLDSVAQQTFPNFECILIDDGSTDGSAALLSAHASRDPRFRTLSIPNGGVSHAKNKGLEQARGQFLTFLDCDDTLEPSALETLYALITETRTDIAIGHISFEDAQGHPTAQTPPLQKKDANLWLMTPEQAAEIVFRGNPFGGHLHAKLLRAETFRTLRYREDLFIYEDMLFFLEALALADRVVYSPIVLHHYLVAESGALASPPNPRKASSLLACEKMKALAKHHFPEAVPAASRFALQNALWVLEELAASSAIVRKESWAKNAIKIACGKIRQPLISKSDFPFVQKCFCQAIRLGWPVFLFVYRVPYRLIKRIFG